MRSIWFQNIPKIPTTIAFTDQTVQKNPQKMAENGHLMGQWANGCASNHNLI